MTRRLHLGRRWLLGLIVAAAAFVPMPVLVSGDGVVGGERGT
jgi:hypothetical protein